MPASIDSAASAGFDSVRPRIETPQQAASAFESLMLKQLFTVMSKSAGGAGMFGKGFAGDVYNDMFADALAQKASGSGLGMAQMIRSALGVEERTAQTAATSRFTANAVRALQSYKAAVTGDIEPPQNAQLAALTGQWLSGDAAARWGKDGALTPEDLAPDIVTEGEGGPAAFNVEDASGYEGHPKCNLFALEMLRRSGFTVPVRARSHGWGFPGADAVTRMARDGASTEWATRLTGSTTEALDALARSGTPLLVSSSATDGRVGHMAVVDRVHNIERTKDGDIAVIEYSGWEAGTQKAGYGRRVWRLEGVPGSGRGGLEGIEVLAPRRAEGNAYVPVDDAVPGASLNEDIGETAMRLRTQGLSETTDGYQ